MKNFQEEKITPDQLREKIKSFYKEDEWHFITINGTDTGKSIEVKYFFAKYGKKEPVYALSLEIDYDQTLPSITDLIPSAWIAEEELYDLLGVKVEKAKGGIFLEPDSPKAPLRKSFQPKEK
ncbi:MAG: NADH-quinone oxidoreductase subunit C [Aquificae bacterium]|jgi:NADH:ubiquinone oxidoreductase subunit C|nr:NADH-quinone oxidoreductase subunit C [Aquificota bacterium]